MRTSRLLASALLILLGCLSVTPVAVAAGQPMAQTAETPSEEEGDGGQGTGDTEGEGSDPTEGEEGPKSEEDAAEPEGGAQEEGPPWTYQMARMTIGLVLLLGVAIGLAYYKFVVVRQRGEV